MNHAGILPAPMTVTPQEGSLDLKQNINIFVSGDCGGVAHLMASFLHNRLSATVQLVSELDKSTCDETVVVLTCHADAAAPEVAAHPLAEEAYELTVSPSGIEISASTAAGVFYGMQSLIQLLPHRLDPTQEAGPFPIHLPALRIADAPRFMWRGVLLDCGRHFFPVPFIKKLLDVMALHKLNRFHWHLCEDQGWRIEVRKYPRLTEVGAWRGGRDGVPRYGGFYTQDEMREVVAYAGLRFIEVVPEVELPGHCGAALASYPHLGCTGRVTETPYYWGVHEDVYCAGQEETFEFLQDVLTEVMDIFPSKWLHIGGDECPKVRWAGCNKCQQRMTSEGLVDEYELQSWFVSRIARFLAKHEKVLVGWDEILEGTADGRGLPPNSVIMSWRGISGGVKAARAGHPVIMTPASHCYLDYRQSLRPGEPGAWYAMLPLEMSYAYEPIPPEPSGEDTGTSSAAACDEASAHSATEHADIIGSEETLCSNPESGCPTEAMSTDASSAASNGSMELAPSQDSHTGEECERGSAVEPPAMMPADSHWVLTRKEASLILGAQANLWTEYVPDEVTAEYMLLPRMSATSEVLWSPGEHRNWESFRARLPHVLAHCEALGIRHRPLI